MKIYLGFTVAGDRSSVEAAKKILGVLQSMGHEVLTSHLMREDAWDADRRVAPQEIFARDMAWLAQCDLFVAEVSGSSFGLGFETGYLLGATQKKTILAYERDAERRISLLIDEWAKPHGDFSHFGLTGPSVTPYVSQADADAIPGRAQPDTSGANRWLISSSLTAFVLARRAHLKADFPREYDDWAKHPMLFLPSPITSTADLFLTHVH